MSILSAAVLMFIVLDPLGNVPFFVATMQRVAPERRLLVTVRELLIALAVLVTFLFVGQYILHLLQLTSTALTTAGGIILMIIALRMIFPRPDAHANDLEGEPFIVPLAIPYVAGPSALATALLLISREPARWLEWLIAIVTAWLATAAILGCSSYLARFLGHRGLIAIERLMGMLLVTVAVQMLLNGLGQFLSDAGLGKQ
jgi:multiple antibiotic resistance protein